jgi:hypothetical protein
MEQNEKWVSSKKYLDMDEYFEWQKETTKKLKEYEYYTSKLSLGPPGVPRKLIFGFV